MHQVSHRMCLCEQNFLSQGGIMCVWFPSQGIAMCQVSHRKVTSCAKDARRMVHLCAKLPTSRSHCVPILPIARCHRVLMLPIRMCDHVPREVITWFPSVPIYQPLCAKVAKSRCHLVPSCPSRGAIVCQVDNHKVPLRTKLLNTSHYVPSCASQGATACKLPIARCHCMPMLPIATCHFVA